MQNLIFETLLNPSHVRISGIASILGSSLFGDTSFNVKVRDFKVIWELEFVGSSSRLETIKKKIIKVDGTVVWSCAKDELSDFQYQELVSLERFQGFDLGYEIEGEFKFNSSELKVNNVPWTFETKDLEIDPVTGICEINFCEVLLNENFIQIF